MSVNTITHGDYAWVPEYFRIDLSSNMTLEYVEEAFKPRHIGIPDRVGDQRLIVYFRALHNIHPSSLLLPGDL